MAGAFQPEGAVPITDLMPRGFASPAVVPTPESAPQSVPTPEAPDPVPPERGVVPPFEVVVLPLQKQAAFFGHELQLTDDEAKTILKVLRDAEVRSHSEWIVAVSESFALQPADPEGREVREAQ